MTSTPPAPAPMPDPIAALPPRKGPGRGKRSMPSLATAGRISVYTTPAGHAWLLDQATRAGCASIGQWADLSALSTPAPDPEKTPPSNGSET